MPISHNEKLAFIKNGKEKEQEFARLFRETAETSLEEDKYGHIDLKISVGVDIKGLKKVKRGDQEINEHLHWIEIKGILGYAGWIYGELVDFFVFELKNYWIVVHKEDLQKLIAERCKDKIKVDKPELYKLYQRAGRKDIITLVTSYDLCYICTTIIKKD